MTTDKGLKGHELFAKFTVNEVNQLDGFSHVKEFEKGDKIFKSNEVCSHIYMLMEGSVYLLLPANPEEFNFAIAKIEKNEIFGLSPLLNSQRYTAQAQCHTKCKVLAIEADRLKKLLQANRPVGCDIINQVARIYYLRYLETLTKLQDIVSQVSIIR